MSGKFITFEGCEGVGKTTQLKLLENYFAKNGIDGYFTREPGGCNISEKIRSIILDANNAEMCDETELLLYAAARFQHTKQIMQPKVRAGDIVVCDRYIHSTLAYQAYARGLDKEWVDTINKFAINNINIDAVIFLDEKPFAHSNRDESDRLELASDKFHEAVYNGYVDLAKYDERIISIDTSGDKYAVHGRVIEALKARGII